ncbi:hypothetical protein K3M67_03000 [Sphingobium sp. V4]|uniref:hypothetical protein n=1 Tax=Sphingobium sp. V4 TaxID=3038927 RepID=UPI0025580E85|nr:hypothetical protein [Sphingobium sp. V4]WIW88964.1 hypothetical protein K3M67_03000 [Sphingobium sp. V4]
MSAQSDNLETVALDNQPSVTIVTVSVDPSFNHVVRDDPIDPHALKEHIDSANQVG